MNVKISQSLKPGNFEKAVKKQILKKPVNIKCPKCDTSVTLKVGSTAKCPTCHTSIELSAGAGWN